MQYPLLRDLAIIFAGSLLVILVFHRLKLPALPGFIVAGVLLGPNALGLVSDVQQVESRAELGVILLLFTIGIQFSLSRLREMGRQVVIGGGAQVLLTVGLSAAVAAALGLAWPVAVLVGFLVALSSTAIVLKGLADKGEIDTPHGRLATGVLIFQDLCVVPMMLVLPFLAGAADGEGGVAGQCGRRERARRARTGGAGLLGTRGPARRPRRVPDRRVLARAGATGSGRGDPSRGPVSDVPRGVRAHDAGDAVRAAERPRAARRLGALDSPRPAASGVPAAGAHAGGRAADGPRDRRRVRAERAQPGGGAALDPRAVPDRRVERPDGAAGARPRRARLLWRRHARRDSARAGCRARTHAGGGHLGSGCHPPHGPGRPGAQPPHPHHRPHSLRRGDAGADAARRRRRDPRGIRDVDRNLCPGAGALRRAARGHRAARGGDPRLAVRDAARRRVGPLESGRRRRRSANGHRAPAARAPIGPGREAPRRHRAAERDGGPGAVRGSGRRRERYAGPPIPARGGGCPRGCWAAASTEGSRQADCGE